MNALTSHDFANRQWCILRTKGSNTLRLTSALMLEGIPAWTPTEVQLRKKHGDRPAAEVMVCVMPTYVFASAECLVELFRLASAPVSPAPSFSVLRHNDRIPMVAERDLTALRTIERKAAAKREPVRFDRGDEVRTDDPAWQGLVGQVVEDTKGKLTLVAFPGFNIPVEFASWKLEKAA